jgi:hypothetical protein
MAEPAPCAHPGCSCTVPSNSQYGKYCSEHCKEARGMTELRCGCNHPGCRLAPGEHAAVSAAG